MLPALGGGGVARLALAARRLGLALWPAGEHPGQGGGRRAVAALPGEAEEGGPDEGAAAGEGGAHVQRHQGKVQELGGAEEGQDRTDEASSLRYVCADVAWK